MSVYIVISEAGGSDQGDRTCLELINSHPAHNGCQVHYTSSTYTDRSALRAVYDSVVNNHRFLARNRCQISYLMSISDGVFPTRIDARETVP